MTNSGNLRNKTALVTGASRGIGKAIAITLAAEGVNIAVNYLNNGEKAEKVCQAVRDSGSRAISIQADVSRSDEVFSLIKQTKDDFGTIDILVNNAGITRPQPLEQITEQDWDELISVNLKSVFLVTQAVLPDMRKAQWGRIINLSSVAAQVGGVVGPHYAASKAGILGLTRSYAHLLRKEGITINAIAPALIETEMVTGNPNASPDLIPVGRFGDVNEVADVAAILAKNGYITGQTLNVNGGWYMT